jgi:hypothetical protein
LDLKNAFSAITTKVSYGKPCIIIVNINEIEVEEEEKAL